MLLAVGGEGDRSVLRIDDHRLAFAIKRIRRSEGDDTEVICFVWLQAREGEAPMIVGGDADMELHALGALWRVTPGHFGDGAAGDEPFDIRRCRPHRVQHRRGHLQRVRHAVLMETNALTKGAEPHEGLGIAQVRRASFFHKGRLNRP